MLTDQKWFSFVLEQLLSNSLKYTNSGSILIETVSTDTSALYLKITDTGIGIRGEDLPRVFEKGFTGYNGRIDQKASGLGLYLCREVMQKLGHSISIDSVEGKGTTVTIRLS